MKKGKGSSIFREMKRREKRAREESTRERERGREKSLGLLSIKVALEF